MSDHILQKGDDPKKYKESSSKNKMKYFRRKKLSPVVIIEEKSGFGSRKALSRKY
jgi:predicted RNA-binding protein